MAQATGIERGSGVSVRWFTLVGVATLVATGLTIALTVGGSEPGGGPPLAPAAAAPRQGPTGLITYEVTGKGFFNARPSGEQLGTASDADLHLVHNATEQDRVDAADGLRSARIERSDAGVSLVASAPGLVDRSFGLSGPADPALVNGGKGAARAVAGIPLVVAWSPDSEKLAYGSITGEPYALQIVEPFGLGRSQFHEVAGGYVGELAWSPDGRYLAISTYSLDRKNHTVFMLDTTRNALAKVSDGCHLTWSPDGKYLAIHRDPGPEAGAWVISPDGHERYAVSREPGAFPYAWREG